jgi:hypothetical protein
MLDEVIHWSCERLSARERDVLRAAATGWATAADAPEIDRLVTLGLLTPVRAGVATHPAIRAIAASL